MFAAPQPTQFDLNFRVAGIPVRVHPMFWLVSILLGSSDPEPKHVLIWVAAVFVSILVHELGHALVIRWYGWRPAIALYGLGGLALYQPTYATRFSEATVAIAGPAAGFACGGAIAALAVASGGEVTPFWVIFGPGLPLGEAALRLVNDLWYVNIWWGVVNLLPVFPLDGGRIARNAISQFFPHEGLRLSLQVSMLCAAAVAVLAVVRLESWYLGLLFGYMAFTSYQILQAVGPRGWR